MEFTAAEESTQMNKTVAALFVEEGGCYYGLDGVDPWGVTRDARLYDGPFPVVAHPPCARWSALWSGGPSARNRKLFGDDNGCFKAALESVRKYGGVIEHPANTKAYAFFGIYPPNKNGGWSIADTHGGFVCHVDQRNYGHLARKSTWLYCTHVILPDLQWGEGEPADHILMQRSINGRKNLPLLRGMKKVTNVSQREGGIRLRNREISATPPAFRDLLISIARSVYDFKPEQAPRTLFAMPEPVPLKQPYGLTVDLDVNVDSS